MKPSLHRTSPRRPPRAVARDGDATAMAMAMGAALKTTMAVTMSMPSRTTARRTTSGTREVRARVDDDASRLGSAHRGSARSPARR